MRIPSGDTSRGFYFVAVDATDRVTFEPGLSSFTVFRSRDGAAEVQMTTPTITEIDATNCPGLYYLLCDEDMTIGASSRSEEMGYRITHAGMAPVTRTIEVYRSLSVTELTNQGRVFGAHIFVTIAAGATKISFPTDLAEATDEHYRMRGLLMLTGALGGQLLPVIGYENSGGALRVLNHTDEAPAENDTGLLLLGM